LYKQRFQPLKRQIPAYVYGNVNDIAYRQYEGLPKVKIKDLLPLDLAFDLNFHILSFSPGGGHPFIETHLQEHGIYILSGQGCYYLKDQWVLTKAEDFLWFGPYCPQGAYGIGEQDFTYIYSKDCNRDPDI